MSAATTKTPLLDCVRDLEMRVQRAGLAPDEVAHERQKALGRAEDARQELRVFYARAEKDAKRERSLREAVEAAEKVADERWDERIAGARMAEGLARDDLRGFIAGHFPELTAELMPGCVLAGQRFEEAQKAYAESLAEKQGLLDDWAVLVSPAGIPLSDLPEVGSLELPVPRSLAAVAREMAETDDEKETHDDA